VSHEVVKSVRGREYRYRVENYRDPETGKVRGRWTYLGRVGPGGRLAAPNARRPARTRERLLDALAALLDRHEFADLTVAAIVEKAGLAHGTFYRHFRDKHDALRAAAGRIREAIERSKPDLAAPPESLAAERARIRAWVESMLRASIDRPGLLREWYAAISRDAALEAERLARRAAVTAAFTSYLERLAAAGVIQLERPAELAEALVMAIDGAFRGLVLTRRRFSEATIAGLCDLFDRAIFSTPR